MPVECVLRKISFGTHVRCAGCYYPVLFHSDKLVVCNDDIIRVLCYHCRRGGLRNAYHSPEEEQARLGAKACAAAQRNDHDNALRFISEILGSDSLYLMRSRKKTKKGYRVEASLTDAPDGFLAVGRGESPREARKAATVALWRYYAEQLNLLETAGETEAGTL